MSLIAALRSGNIQSAIEIIKEENFDPSETDAKTGYTAMHFAVELESEELVRKLLDIKNYDLKSDLTARDKKKNVSGQFGLVWRTMKLENFFTKILEKV